MSDVTRVALDAMGGDNATGEIVKGAGEAGQRRSESEIMMNVREGGLKKERGG